MIHIFALDTTHPYPFLSKPYISSPALASWKDLAMAEDVVVRKIALAGLARRPARKVEIKIRRNGYEREVLTKVSEDISEVAGCIATDWGATNRNQAR